MNPRFEIAIMVLLTVVAALLTAFLVHKFQEVRSDRAHFDFCDQFADVRDDTLWPSYASCVMERRANASPIFLNVTGVLD